MDPTLLAILACPKCRGELELVSRESREGLSCQACALVYPIEEDIPVLLIEEAIARKNWDDKTACRAD